MDLPESAGFKVWGADEVVYGPVELPTLVGWVRDDRVTATTWIYDPERDRWSKAGDLAELKMFFKPAGESSNGSTAARDGHFTGGIKPSAFRRIKILADLRDDQLERMVEFVEVENIRQWSEVIRQGEPAEAIYLIMEGELRVRLMIAGKESLLATLNAGEFFGEVAIFDQGPRSADVIANRDCVLLKITADSFARMLVEAPDVTSPLLFAVGKTLVARIRADNKRFRDTVSFSRTAGVSND